MNSSQGSVFGMIGRLSTGVPKVSIRWAGGYKKPRQKPKKYHLTGFKEGLGEEIFVFNHTEDGMILYSHDKEIKREAKRLLDQIPFTAKKLKPPVLRKDYWEPLCLIKFDKGQGEIGRNVFQKLREYRRLHELSWGWQAPELVKMNKLRRGKTILNQKRNAIADIAAVLGGAGKGNKMWTIEPAPEATEEDIAESTEEIIAEEFQQPVPEAEAVEAAIRTREGEAVVTEPATATSTATEAETTPAEEATEAAAPNPEKRREGPQKRLLKATVYWANDADVNWAREWTPNVDHQIGLPDDIRVHTWKTRYFYNGSEEPEAEAKPEDAEESAEGEAKDGEAKDGEAKDGEAKEGESKEGEVKDAEFKDAEVKEDAPKVEEKMEQPAEEPKPAKKGIFGSLFGRKS